MLPSTWTECWQSLQAGHSIQSKHLNLSSSNWQNFHSLNEMLNAVALIVGTHPFYFENSSRDLRNERSETPGICFCMISQWRNRSWSKTYDMSLILPGQKPHWVTTTGSEVESTLEHSLHLYLWWFTSNRPTINHSPLLFRDVVAGIGT